MDMRTDMRIHVRICMRVDRHVCRHACRHAYEDGLRGLWRCLATGSIYVCNIIQIIKNNVRVSLGETAEEQK